MISWQRAIFSDNGVLNDISVAINDFKSGSATTTLTMVYNQDAIYLGSDLPFNHRYFDIGVANSNSSVVSVEIWDGTSWVSAVDVIDGTSVGGKTFAQSGVIQWTVDKDKTSWAVESESEDVTGLTGTYIYDMYWARIKVSATTSATATLAYVGHKFSTDDDLYLTYPDLNNSQLKTNYKSGKTDWNEQHFMASRFIVADLKKRNIIISGSQILDYNLFLEASIHRTANIIYSAFGEAFKFMKEESLKSYKSAMDINFFNVDKSNDGRLDPSDKAVSARTMNR